ncbi:MAG: hypothetical protein U0Y10_01325 [Spirosomataceae bacterium]
MEVQFFEKVYNQFIRKMETDYCPQVADEPFRMTHEEYLAIIEKFRISVESQKKDFFQRPFGILVFNLKKLQVDFSFGIENFLGIKDIELGQNGKPFFKRICKSFHPEYFQAFWLQAHVIYMSTLDYGSEILKSPTSLSTAVVVPLLCKDGKYYWIEFRTQILQYDSQGHIISHAMRFELIKPYSPGVEYVLEINIFINGLMGLVFHQLVAKNFKKKLHEYFSPTEWNLIRDYAGIDDGVKEKHTKDYLNKLRFKIVHKASVFFGYKFQKVETLATYLREKQLLS